MLRAYEKKSSASREKEREHDNADFEEASAPQEYGRTDDGTENFVTHRLHRDV